MNNSEQLNSLLQFKFRALVPAKEAVVLETLATLLTPRRKTLPFMPRLLILVGELLVAAQAAVLGRRWPLSTGLFVLPQFLLGCAARSGEEFSGTHLANTGSQVSLQMHDESTLGATLLFTEVTDIGGRLARNLRWPGEDFLHIAEVRFQMLL